MTSVIDGVGKASNDGPKSPWTNRRQKFTYCSGSGLSTPYRSVSAERICSMASGLKFDRAVIRLSMLSTGLTGERWLIRNAIETPTKMTTIICVKRLSANHE